MPRYFFDTVDGDRDCDNVGVECPEHDEAVCEAVRYLGGLISDRPEMLSPGHALVVTVRSEAGPIARVQVELSLP